MDESYLSDPQVIAAARNFVCIRLLTYESAEETEFLQPLLRTRSGNVENTTFVFLAPDGETKLTRAGRSPQQVFRGTPEDTMADLLETMQRIAKKNPPQVLEKSPLPFHQDLRRGLNAAACDMQPIVVVAARDQAQFSKIAQQLRPLAWSDEFRGRFAFARVDNWSEEPALANIDQKSGVFVLRPDPYGVDAELLGFSSAESSKNLAKVMQTSLESAKIEAKRPRELILQAGRRGLEWETEVPNPYHPRNQRQRRSKRSRGGE